MLIGRTYRDFQQFDRARAALQRALKMNPRVGRAHYYLGTSAILEEGVVRLDEAIAEFKKELEITPDDPLSTLRLGVVLVEARRYAEARPLLERSIKVASPSYDAWLYLGRCQQAEGEATAAVASLRRALDIAGRMPAAPGATDVRRRSLHYQLATALRATGETAEADRQFAEAQRLSVEQAASERDQLARFMADSGDAGAAGSLPLGIAGFDALGESERADLLKRVQTVLARAYLNLGIMQAQASRFGRAAEQLELAASIDPEFPQLQYSLGVAYFNAAQYEKAVPVLTRASGAQPQNADVRRMLAMALLNAGDYGKAADLLRTDPALPKDPSLQYAYGVALVRSNRADEADKIFSRVLSEHPDVPELNVVIGQIHAARGDYDAAVAALRRALELRSTVPEANASLGDIYMRQGKLAEAAAALHAELAVNPGNLQARHTLAIVLDLDGKSDDALRELRTIVAARPNYADARYLFGKILLARGDASGALAHLEVAVRAAPDDANIHYQLGQAYQRLGRSELAAHGVRKLPAAEGKAARRSAVRGLSVAAAMLALCITPGALAAQAGGARPAPGSDDRAAVLAQAAAAQKAGRDAEAMTLFRTAGDKYQSVQAYLALARLEVRARQPQAAMTTLGKARVLAPNSEEVLDAFSQLALTVKQPMPGVIALQALTRMCPSVAAYHYLLGVGLMAIGDMPGAVEALAEADRLEPERPLTLLALGLALNNRKLFAEAKAALTHSLELQPESVEAVAALSEAEAGLGEFDAAGETRGGSARARADERDGAARDGAGVDRTPRVPGRRATRC